MIIYDGTKVFFNTLVYEVPVYLHEDWCAICNIKLYKGDTINLIMNSNILFPNVHVHQACIESKMKCTEHLIDKHKQFKFFLNEYRVWIARAYPT